MHFANCVALTARHIANRKNFEGQEEIMEEQNFFVSSNENEGMLYWYYTRIHLFMNS